MGKKSTASRRQRRMNLRRANFLKIKNMFGPFTPQGKAWYDKMREDGKEMHNQHISRMMDIREEKLEATLNSMKTTWANIGYNDSEIEMLAEAWMATVIKDPDHQQARADKKEARRLQAQAKASLIERNAK